MGYPVYINEKELTLEITHDCITILTTFAKDTLSDEGLAEFEWLLQHVDLDKKILARKRL